MAEKAGGQAVFEGVMMRGDDRWAVAVRRPDGEIEVLSAELPQLLPGLKRVPFVRGIIALAEALPLGMRALRWSAVHGLGEPERRATPAERVTQVLTLVAVLGLVVSVPAYGTRWLVGGFHHALLSAVVENLFSIGILVAYAAAIGRLAVVQRLFENHGAEHKVVAAYEAGVDLTPEAAAGFDTRHVRCGTSLLLVIGVVSGIFYVLLGHQPLPELLATRIAVIPLVAAVATEIQLRAAENTHRRWVRALLRPGFALQRLTTRQPTLEQLEVAVVALQAAYATETAIATQPSSSVTAAVPA